MVEKWRDAVSGRLTTPRAERQRIAETARGFRKVPTKSETMLWEALRGGRIAGVRFCRQHPIGRFIVDFCCPAQRLIIEIDGSVHAERQQEDEARQAALEARGYRFLRISAVQIERDFKSVIGAIEAAVRGPA